MFAWVQSSSCVVLWPSRQARDVYVIQESTQLGLNEGLMLAQCEKHGHEGISLVPSLPLRDVLGDPQLVFPQIRTMRSNPLLELPDSGLDLLPRKVPLKRPEEHHPGQNQKELPTTSLLASHSQSDLENSFEDVKHRPYHLGTLLEQIGEVSTAVGSNISPTSTYNVCVKIPLMVNTKIILLGDQHQSSSRTVWQLSVRAQHRETIPSQSEDPSSCGESTTVVSPLKCPNRQHGHPATRAPLHKLQLKNNLPNVPQCSCLDQVGQGLSATSTLERH